MGLLHTCVPECGLVGILNTESFSSMSGYESFLQI
jgi:hypothetical protein